MRCPKCKGSVPDKLTVITCPSCGAPVRRIPITTDLRFAVTVMAERNGWLFWTVLAMPFWILVAMFQLVLGDGSMAKLFNTFILMFFVHSFFSGLIMDILMKTNAFVMRISEKETLSRAPLPLRRFRLGTNFSVLLAAFLAIWYNDFVHWAIAPFLGTTLAVLLVGLWWSWYPYMLNLGDFEDRRIESFFYEFGMMDAGRWRRMAVWVMGTYIFAGAVCAYMIAVPGAYRWLTESEFIQFVVSRATTMFYFVPDFFK